MKECKKDPISQAMQIFMSMFRLIVRHSVENVKKYKVVCNEKGKTLFTPLLFFPESKPSSEEYIILASKKERSKIILWKDINLNVTHQIQPS